MKILPTKRTTEARPSPAPSAQGAADPTSLSGPAATNPFLAGTAPQPVNEDPGSAPSLSRFLLEQQVALALVAQASTLLSATMANGHKTAMNTISNLKA